MFVNLIVATSNLSLLYYIYGIKLSRFQILFICAPMMASSMYHLADTKHGLTGLYPLNIYENELLFLDRFFALVSFCKVVQYIVNNSIKISLINCSMLGILGVVCLFFSERDIIYKEMNIYEGFEISTYQFLIFHSAWHIIAFRILSIAFL